MSLHIRLTYDLYRGVHGHATSERFHRVDSYKAKKGRDSFVLLESCPARCELRCDTASVAILPRFGLAPPEVSGAASQATKRSWSAFLGHEPIRTRSHTDQSTQTYTVAKPSGSQESTATKGADQDREEGARKEQLSEETSSRSPFSIPLLARFKQHKRRVNIRDSNVSFHRLYGREAPLTRKLSQWLRWKNVRFSQNKVAFR